jgi:hypothetical protein
MPRQSAQAQVQGQVQLLRHLIREYVECVTTSGDCESLRGAVRSIAALVGGELGRDALRLIESDGYEP